MTGKTEGVTIEHLTNTLKRIEEWVGLVRKALEQMEGNEQVPMVRGGQPSSIAARREWGGDCAVLMPESWIEKPGEPAK